MPETIEELIRTAIKAAQEGGELPAFEIDDLGIERPADTDHGEWTSTVALRSAKLAHKAPKQIADAIVAHLPANAAIKKVEVAGPGFINFHLNAAANNSIFTTIINQGKDYGRSDAGHGEKVQVEFISANPTGPLHIGHGRWSAIGDSLCNVLDFAGYDVQREYYINDRGTQMDLFGASVFERYKQIAALVTDGKTAAEAACALLEDREAYIADESDEHPQTYPLTTAFNEALGENAYGGDYIIEIARDFYEQDADKYLQLSEDEARAALREKAYGYQLAKIKETCDKANCRFDSWKSERTFYEPDKNGKTPLDTVFEMMSSQDLLYQTDDGATWFKTTEFGDDKDRVVVKSDGDFTYFASDVYYTWDKFNRFDYEINILGADHHGYIKRVQAVAAALGHPGKYEVVLGQLVNLLRGGEPVRMSKRRGTMVTFDELLDEVGCDATRYTLISRSSNQPIDFDIEEVKKQESSNPVFYVQYAHARICSILRRAAGVTLEEAQSDGMARVAKIATGGDVDVSLLVEPSEIQLARRLSEFPDLVAGCARDRAPFRITHYVQSLAADFHRFYTECPILPREDKPLDEDISRARLAVCDAVRIVLENALRLIGVSAPQKM